jgi:hypothetical protein
MITVLVSAEKTEPLWIGYTLASIDSNSLLHRLIRRPQGCAYATKRLAWLVHSRGDGLSSPIRTNLRIVALVCIESEHLSKNSRLLLAGESRLPPSSRCPAACSQSSSLVDLLAGVGGAHPWPERTAHSIPSHTYAAVCLSLEDRGLLARWVRCLLPTPHLPSAAYVSALLRSHQLSAHSTASRSSSWAELGCLLRLFI